MKATRHEVSQKHKEPYITHSLGAGEVGGVDCQGGADGESQNFTLFTRAPPSPDYDTMPLNKLTDDLLNLLKCSGRAL